MEVSHSSAGEINIDDWSVAGKHAIDKREHEVTGKHEMDAREHDIAGKHKVDVRV